MQPIIDNLLLLRQKCEIFFSNPDSKNKSVDSFRVFHGRGQCYLGLEFICVDFFQPVLLLTCFREPPEHWLDEFLVRAIPFFHSSITTVLLQKRYEPKSPTDIIWGEAPEQVNACRGDLQFSLQLGQQQNAGFFLDMEPGRRWLESNARGQRILNLFSYTCAFSVVAIAAGAERVVNVDMSGRALQIGRENHQLNALPKERSEYLAENIMKSWGRIKRRGPYDIVIIDPPSYQPGSFVAQKDYLRVVRRLPELLPHGGLVLACLNAPELGSDFLTDMFSDVCPKSEFIERLGAHPDFPDVNPNQQLKLLVFSIPISV